MGEKGDLAPGATSMSGLMGSAGSLAGSAGSAVTETMAGVTESVAEQATAAVAEAPAGAPGLLDKARTSLTTITDRYRENMESKIVEGAIAGTTLGATVIRGRRLRTSDAAGEEGSAETETDAEQDDAAQTSDEAGDTGAAAAPRSEEPSTTDSE